MGEQTRIAEVAGAHGAFRREITKGDMVTASRTANAATGRERREEHADVLRANIAVTTLLAMVADYPRAESTNEVSSVAGRHRA